MRKGKWKLIKAKVLHVKAKSREQAELDLGEAFNAWIEENKLMEVHHLFEPERTSKIYGDHTYNEYHVTMTFFYRIPYALREQCKE